MNYSQLGLHPSNVAASPGTEKLEGHVTSSLASNGSDLLAYSTSTGIAKVHPVIPRALESAPSESRKFTLRERFRVAFSVLLTLLYLGLLAWMFYLSDGSPDVGLTANVDNSGRWVVSGVVPSGLSYDGGVRPGDVVVATRVDGKAVNPTVLLGSAAASIKGAKTIEVQKAAAPSDHISVSTQNVEALDPVRRWAFALLGLIFIGVGGPVYAKARQRTAALAFYAFCLLSAVALAVAPVSFLLSGAILALMFVTMVSWAGSFAFFFTKFPTRIGRSTLLHNFLCGAIIGVGALLLASYAWSATGHPSDYAWVQPLEYVYLASCLGLGLGRLVWLQVAERSTEIREQLTLLLVGTGLAVGPPLILGLLPMILFGHPLVRLEIASLSVGIMPLAFAYAITQHQLLGMRSFLRRGVIYIVMGTSVLFIFSLAAATLGSIFTGWEKSEWGLVAFGFFVFSIALSFGYIQRRVERLVDRYIYHDAYDYKEALLSFSTQLAAEQNLQVLADKLVERTCRLMNLSCGVLLLASPSTLEEGSVFGTEDGFPTTSKLKPMGNGSSGSNNRRANRAFEAMPEMGHDAATRVLGPDGHEEPPYLMPYSTYGEGADWLVSRLAEELSQLGVAIRSADAPTQLMSIFERTTGDLLRTSPDSGFLRTQILPDLDTAHKYEHGGAATVMLDAQAPLTLEAMASENGMFTSGPGRLDFDAIHSFVGLPLWTRSRFVGIFCLGGKKTGERFSKDDLSLLSTLGGQAALAIYNAQLYEAREQALLDTISALAHAIEAKDNYTINHCENMTGRAVALAQAMGLPRQEVENIRLGAILHDVGKIGIPDAVLNKPGRLTHEEYEVIKQHASIGARIVQSVGALQGVVPIVRHHQERYDGEGYPAGLIGEEIPLGARIISVVDAYGAMTEDRIYRKALGHMRATAELKGQAGRQFDPLVVDAFLRLLRDRPELGEM